jgi:DNA repair protein RadC
VKPTLVASLPETERPRERLARLGAEALSDRELLAILLRSGRRGQSAIDLAAHAIESAGGLPRLAFLSPAQLSKSHRLGTVQAITLAAAFEIARRATAVPPTGERFEGPEAVMRYLRQRLGHLGQERTGALYFDAKHRLLQDVVCYWGTLDRALVEPREILKRALLEDAAALILYHNHPSGDPTPSAEDVEFTRRVARAAELLGIRFLDHVVVGREGCVSLRERGIL